MSVHRKPVEARDVPPKVLQGNGLWESQCNGGGGIRTPVPRCFKISIYVRSRSIEVSLRRAPNDRLSTRLFRCISPASARTTDEGQPADWRPCRTRRRNPTGRAALFTQPWHTGSCHLRFRYRMISQANRHPGHAAYPSTIRSKPFAPIFTYARATKLSCHYTRSYAGPPAQVPRSAAESASGSSPETACGYRLPTQMRRPLRLER